MNSTLLDQFKRSLSSRQKTYIKASLDQAQRGPFGLLYLYGRYLQTPIRLIQNRSLENRRLEIGPGQSRIEGFETANISWAPHVDYVIDASKRLPFEDECFSLIYASHILEHIPWYNIDSVLAEWTRVIRPGGLIEIWVPNALLICKAFIDAEEGSENRIGLDGWYKFNDDRDPCIWANGRVFSYGDGTGRRNDPNWHLTMFSPRFLRKSLEKQGYVDIVWLDRCQVRGHDHGWINLGIRGRKS